MERKFEQLFSSSDSEIDKALKKVFKKLPAKLIHQDKKVIKEKLKHQLDKNRLTEQQFQNIYLESKVIKRTYKRNKNNQRKSRYVNINELIDLIGKIRDNPDKQSKNKYIRKATRYLLSKKRLPTACELNRFAGWLVGLNNPFLNDKKGDGTSQVFDHIKSSMAYLRRKYPLGENESEIPQHMETEETEESRAADEH